MYVLLFIADPNDPHPTPYMSDDAPGFLSVHPSGYQKGHSSQIHYDYFHHWGGGNMPLSPDFIPSDNSSSQPRLARGLRASNYTMAPFPLPVSVFSGRRLAHPRPLPRPLARGSSLAGPPYGIATVACGACFERDTMFGINEVAR